MRRQNQDYMNQGDFYNAVVFKPFNDYFDYATVK